MTTEKETWDLLESLEYRVDQRLPPDSVRQGNFLSGWTWYDLPDLLHVV